MAETYNQSLADPGGHPDMTFDTYAGYAPDFLSPADFFTSFVSRSLGVLKLCDLRRPGGG